ncbi:hypothetical protein [Mangrovimonas sp. TPBH4]|uniref:hypothetical protein n=1 Tax=Mangrovimonas sp. TPBH4 TaxID=1645914 RepID=UPI0006B44714|nr:hypothetical protein [Mangrovimonas sp. TPBH4]
MNFYKRLLLLVSINLFAFGSFAQDAVNNYKYIIIPTKYEFLKANDEYQLNSLTKFLFNKYGFTAFFNNETLPADLQSNRCLALYANVTQIKGGLFKTKLQIDLKNCDGKVIESSQVGESREKSYDTAYTMALRDAFETFQYMGYVYEPVSGASQSVVPVTETTPVTSNTVKENTTTVAASASVSNTVKSTPSAVGETETLYAQALDKGYQLVDRTPKVVMVLLETSKADVFVVKGSDAIVYKENGTWYYSHNDGTSVNSKTLNIKF